MPPRPMPRPLPRPIVRPPARPSARPVAAPAVISAPYPVAVAAGCPPCPPCAVYGVSPVPPAAGKPYLFPIDEMPDAAPVKDLLPGFPPFRREDLVPEDEWSAFSGLGAGPDPKTMTCEKIIKGYEQNAYMAQFRVKAQHKANAAARVKELEPYYQQCKGKTTVTPEQPVEPPVDTRLREGELYGPFTSETTPASHRVTGSVASGLDIDWKLVAGIVGAGVLGLIVLKTIKKKKSASSSTSHGLNFSE